MSAGGPKTAVAARGAARRARFGARSGGLALLAAASLCAAVSASPAAAARPTPTITSPAGAGAGAPSRATVIEVQRLFGELGYPLGGEPLGGLGPRTAGALRYFQRKYGLPVTGRADPRTIRDMRSVAESLRRPPSIPAKASQPHDAVEAVLGQHTPILAIAVSLAALLALLALRARERPA